VNVSKIGRELNCHTCGVLQGLAEAGRAYTTSLSTVDASVLRKSLQLLANARDREALAAPVASPPPVTSQRHSTGHMTMPPADFLSSALYASKPVPAGAEFTPAQLARMAADWPTKSEVRLLVTTGLVGVFSA
jgi:hypothetical protein